MKLTVWCGNEDCARYDQRQQLDLAEPVPGVYDMPNLRCGDCHWQIHHEPAEEVVTGG